MDRTRRVGGVGEERSATPEIQKLCDSVKPAFEAQSGVNTVEFKVVKWAIQVVAGTNNFVKVWLGGDDYCHVKIFEPLPFTGEPATLAGTSWIRPRTIPLLIFRR